MSASRPSGTSQTIGLSQVVAYISLSVIWGCSFMLIVRVASAFGWIGAVAIRAIVASALLFMLARVIGRKLSFGASWWHFAVVGSTTVAGQLIGLTYATPRIGTAMAAILVGTIPLFSMGIGHFWGIERIDHSRFGGLVIGVIGIVLLVGFPTEPVSVGFLVGCGASVFGSISAAFGSNYARRHLAGVGSWEQTIGAFLSGGVIAMPLLWAVPVPTVPTITDVELLIGLAGTCSALAYVLYFRLVAEIGPTRAISVEFAVTAVAVAVGAVFLDERLSVAQLVGGATIMIGCAIVLGFRPAWLGDGRGGQIDRRAEYG